MPAKSGVSGCIIAVIPGQIGICVFSPPIDSQGNSVRGIRVCQEISNEFELHAFNNCTNVRSVIRRDYRADSVRSAASWSGTSRTGGVSLPRSSRSYWCNEESSRFASCNSPVNDPARPSRIRSARSMRLI